MEAVKGKRTLIEISDRLQVHANQLAGGKKHLMEKTWEIFEIGKKYPNKPDVKELRTKIGRLTMENTF
jgi:transposase